MPRFDDIEQSGLTDVGIRRSHNQDAYSVQQAPDADYWRKVGHFFVVADGMGGHAVGEKARPAEICRVFARSSRRVIIEIPKEPS